MTLLEEIYHQLKSAGLVSGAEAFSQRYLSRNRNWYSHHVHYGREFSIGAAIECLRSLRSQQRNQTLGSVQQRALVTAAHNLQNHIFATYGITDVA